MAALPSFPLMWNASVSHSRGSLLEARLSSLCDAGPRAWEEARPSQTRAGAPHMGVQRGAPWPLAPGDWVEWMLCK